MAVQLVHHHVAQVLEQLHPLGVVREDPLVQHVGVGDHDVGARTDGLARVLRRVAVVREGPDVGAHGLDHAVELGQLVLGQGLGGKEVQRASVRVLQDAVEDGQVVAERLARRGGRDHHRAPSLARRLVGQGLVRVGPRHAAGLEDFLQLRMQVRREFRMARGLGREVPQRGQHGLGPQRLLDLEELERGEEGRFRVLAADDELTHPDPHSPRPNIGGNRIVPWEKARAGPIQFRRAEAVGARVPFVSGQA
jgi:hypothetical protein